MRIVSLTFGIVGLPLVGILVGWFAIWFGATALRQIEASQRLQGRTLALAGIALGVVDVVLWTLLVVVYGHSLFPTRLGVFPRTVQ
jgi:hypothetical protein